MGVATLVGQMTLTVIPCDATSIAADFASPITPHFAAT